jgi:hypothetical protein
MSDFPKNQMLGFCSSCGKSIIDLKKKGKKASAKFTEDYREHIIELSNFTIMRIAVCAECKEYLVSGAEVIKMAQKIVDNHILYWKNHKKGAPKNYDKIKVVNPNTTPRDFMRKKEKKRREEEVVKFLTI